MSLFQTYLQSSPRTKAMVGFGILAWGAIGLYTSDGIGSAIGIKPTQEDEEKLRKNLPQVTTINRDGT